MLSVRCDDLNTDPLTGPHNLEMPIGRNGRPRASHRRRARPPPSSTEYLPLGLYVLARQVGLKLPQLRRIYDNAVAMGARIHELEQANSRSEREREEARTEAASQSERANRMSDELEAMKLNVYTAKGDLNRSLVQVEKLRGELRAAEQRPSVSELALRDARIAELRAHLAQSAKQAEALYDQLTSAMAWRAELDQSYCQLLGATSLLSSDVNGLRQLVATGEKAGPDPVELRQRYQDLLEAALTGQLARDQSIGPNGQDFDQAVRLIGRDWPSLAMTMIGNVRIRNLRTLIDQIIAERIEGDLLEAGVWRGGACIYMRGILASYDDRSRRVFVADSFAGLPPPTPDLYPADANDPHHTFSELAVPLETVKENFARFGLLDNQVVFLQGWFKDTLPKAPVEKLALLRLDGDMYSSTMETLEALYLKVAPGGFVVIDDYILPPCREAVTDFRKRMKILDPIRPIDGAGVYWRKKD